MTVAAPREPRAVSRRESPSRWPLLGMYGLLAATVGCVATAAGTLFFTADGSLSQPLAAALNRCALRFPSTGYLSATTPELGQCDAGPYRTEGGFVLVAAVAVIVVTAGLIFVVPWLDRWRLARAGRWPDVPGASARFELLCDEAGLTGRRRPRLQVGGLALWQAFTTALPGNRPLVVIPIKTALSHDDPARFDPIVLHELAHVRAGDVSWVSAVRGLALITIPAVTLACVPEVLVGTDLTADRTLLLQGAVFVAGSLLVAAALLRRREIDADRQAAWWVGSPAALDAVLGSAGPSAGGGKRAAGRWALRPLAPHPPLAARIAALRDPLGTHDSGFAWALVTGAVAAMVIDASFFIAWTFDFPLTGDVPAWASAVAGGLVLGLGLAPVLLRRAVRARAAGRPARWWQPVAGTTAGMLLGSLVAPGTGFGTNVSFFYGEGPRAFVIPMLMACAGAGLATLTAGLASLAVSVGPERPPSWLTALVAVAAGCLAVAVLVPIPIFQFGETERLFLVFVLAGDPWRWLALPYLVAAAALVGWAAVRRAFPPPPAPLAAGRTRPGWGRLARVVAGALVTPVVAATAAAVLFFPRDQAAAGASSATVVRLAEEQWWVSVGTGLVVLVVLAIAQGIAGLAPACVCAWAATVVVSLERCVYGACTGGGWHYFGVFPVLVTTPSVWLLYLAVPACCVALLNLRLPAPLERPWAVPAVAGAAAAWLAVAVFASGIPGLFVPLAATASVPLNGPGPGTGQLPPAATPSGVLTQAEAQVVIDRVADALPASWTTEGSGSADAGSAKSTVTPAACLPLYNVAYLGDFLPPPVVSAEGDYQVTPGTFAGFETLTVLVSSFARPVPAVVFAAAHELAGACPQYTEVTSAGSTVYTVREVPVGGLAVRAWGVEVSGTVTAKATKERSSETTIFIVTGHNVVYISQTTGLYGGLAPAADAAIDDVLTAVTGSRDARVAHISGLSPLSGGSHDCVPLGPRFPPVGVSVCQPGRPATRNTRDDPSIRPACGAW